MPPKTVLLQLSSFGLVLCLPTSEISRDSKHYPGTWGETHKRDSEVSSSEAKTPFIVLPSSKNSNGYSLTDLPRNNDWGLVEIDFDVEVDY